MADEELKFSSYNPSKLRTNSLVTIIGKNTNHKLLFKLYGKHFSDFKQFKQILENLPQDAFLVIDQTAPHNKLENMIFWWKID